MGEILCNVNGMDIGENDVSGMEEMILNERGQLILRRKEKGDVSNVNNYSGFDGAYTENGFVFQVCPFKENNTDSYEKGGKKSKGKICGDNCPLFHRPVYNREKGVWTIKICCGVEHKGTLIDKRRIAKESNVE